MSTFSGLSTALSSLIAQRQALEVAGQNVANAKTAGYTRQRAELGAVAGAGMPAVFSTSDVSTGGVRVDNVARLGDVFLDARLRTTTASASSLGVIADAAAELEKTLGEPSDTGLSAQLDTLWSAWNDLAATPDKEAARAVVLEATTAVVDRLATLRTETATQWGASRDKLTALVDQVNASAASVADLNEQIRAITASGGTANELMDARDALAVQLSGLAGATVQTRADGQVDVLVGGTPLVSGATARSLTVAGSTQLDEATAPGGAQAVHVEWAHRPGVPAGVDGGQVAGLLTVLAPAESGGLYADVAASYDEFATDLATRVNAIHTTGRTPDGAAGGPLFTFEAGMSAALGLRVAVTDPAGLATAGSGEGALGGSVAAEIAALADAADGPSSAWTAIVVDLGVRTASAGARADVAEAVRASADARRTAQISVDTDEETINMLAFQRAYEGAARVLTAVDEMLDTLINRTGVVGR
ncbi:flagellar hook-associated protein FlgK [Puerhibacterium puerhi]|uniref:flagellar hook-associated protein FlgK n=1 Tax=Puerhibacterium puerhi TaxID=2692623 RepID=UPI001357AAAC|nr:flagellar hook-associated protein FlgK [Puerhibacterium puerhi]